MTLILAAIAPATILLIFFYKIDRFEPEPIKLLLLLYFLGMISVIPILILEVILGAFNIFSYFDSDLTNLYDALIVAGFSEELFKWAIIIVFVYRSKEFDEYLDGIVYCVFVSLGFATIENILYVIDGSYSVAFIRAFLSVPAHMLFGVSMGYYISISKFSTTKAMKSRYMALALVVPILLHGAYDYFLMSRYTFLLIGFIPFMIWLWLHNVKRLKSYYENAKLNFEYNHTNHS